MGAVLALCAGCQQSRSWYGSGSTPPPTTMAESRSHGHRDGRAVVEVTAMEMPRRASVRYRDLGSGMGDALARMLLKRADFDVRVDPRGPRRADAVLKSSRYGSARNSSTGAAPDVDYLVSGKVTDFNPRLEDPGGFGSNETAVVAIDFRIVETRTGRVVAADHVRGTSKVDKHAPESYEDIEFGSYAFWTTPLGRASVAALEHATQRIAAVVPLHAGQPTVAGVIDGGRELRVTGGRNAGLAPGQEFYLYGAADAEGRRQPILDAALGSPVTVRIIHAGPDDARAWLLGRPRSGTELRGSVLSREAPRSAGEVPPRTASR
jgi:curli biogenesis system outer membrane secretion channel CsgG